MANTPTGIGYISFASRYEVDVAVEDGLPRNLARVRPNVEPFDERIMGGNELSRLPYQLVACTHLIGGERETVAHMPPGDDQCVRGGDWEGIPKGDAKVIREEDPGGIRFTKDAIFHESSLSHRAPAAWARRSPNHNEQSTQDLDRRGRAYRVQHLNATVRRRAQRLPQYG